MNILETAHTGNTGLIMTSLNEEDITGLAPEYLLAKLREHGYVVLRGFQHSIAGFSRLVRQTSSRISLDPARSFDGDTAQKVDAGYDKVGLHCENGNSPFWPDLCWFYCLKAPERGSQTTVCDGKQVYQHLSARRRRRSARRTSCTHAGWMSRSGKPMRTMRWPARPMPRPA
ncbi:Taurine catabolism dioxygenase TauD, TfdA family [Serratia plymuthica]|nr:Taurine catabolism dioxygenase TauD, TfdA family [Serratia plymuthica]